MNGRLRKKIANAVKEKYEGMAYVAYDLKHHSPKVGVVIDAVTLLPRKTVTARSSIVLTECVRKHIKNAKKLTKLELKEEYNI